MKKEKVKIDLIEIKNIKILLWPFKPRNLVAENRLLRKLNIMVNEDYYRNIVERLYQTFHAMLNGRSVLAPSSSVSV